MFRRNKGKLLKKLEGETMFHVEKDFEETVNLPLFKTTLGGNYLVTYRIEVRRVEGGDT